MIEVSVPAADIAIATTNPVAAEIAEKSFGVAAIAEKLVVVVAAAAGIEATAVVLAAGIAENLNEEEKSDVAGIEAKVVHDISEIEEKAVFVAGIAENLNQAAKSVVPGKAAKSAGSAAKSAAAATISETAAAVVVPHRRVWRANAAAPRAVAAIRVPHRCCPRQPPPARRRL